MPVTPIPFELRPDAPREGLSAEAEGLGHSEHVERRILEMAAAAGLEMHLIDLVPNTHDAMLMAEYARDQGPEVYSRVHAAIFSAYYAEERDIGDREVLLDVASKEGLDTDEVRKSWEEGAYEERLHSFLHLAIELGVSTTPAALVCHQLIVGTRPYRTLRDAMAECVEGEQES